MAQIAMKLLDFKVEGDKAVISVQIRVGSKPTKKGGTLWNVPYGIPVVELKNFKMDVFKGRVLRDAEVKLMELELESEAMKQLRSSVGKTIKLS